MKIKKFIIFSLIIILMPISMLFGCETKKPKLLAYLDEETLVESKISLQLPIEDQESTEILETEGEILEDSTEAEEEPKDPSCVSIIIDGKDKTKAYANGLDFSFSKQNIYLQISEPELKDDKYIINFQAKMPGNIDVTIKTKDNKMQTTLSFEITQDIKKIELNENSKNYVVVGERKAVSIEQIINFTPQTTTKKDVILELTQEYEGVTLENNIIYIEKNIADLSQICLKATSSEYFNEEKTDEEKQNLIVEQIYFDVIPYLNDIVLVNDDGTNNLAENITLLTNNESQSGATFYVKSKEQDAFKKYLDIPTGFEIKYDIISEYKNFVLITSETEGDVTTLTVKQNMKTGTAKIQVYAQNIAYPSYRSRVFEFGVEVLNAPTAVRMNGNRNKSSMVIYDSYANGLGEPITFDIIGASNNLETYISINVKEAQDFSLVNSFGVKVDLTNVKSGTTLYLSASSAADAKTETLITASVNSTNPNVKIDLKNEMEIKVVKSLADATIKDENGKINNFILSKVDESGNSPILNLTINKIPEDAYFKSYTVKIENENIVKYIESEEKNAIQLKSLTVGSTNVKITFDNGLVKEFTVSVFMPVDEIKIDFSEEDKQTILGKIEYDGTSYKQIYVKTGERLEFEIKRYYKNKLVSDGTVISADYEINDNNENIAIDNTTNILTAINKGKQIKVKPLFSCYDANGVLNEISVSNFGGTTNSGELLVDVYIPIDSISLNKEFFTLYTEQELGYFDKDSSTDVVSLNIEPLNASYKDYITNPVGCTIECAEAEIEVDKTDVENVVITAKSLKEKTEELDTISFTIKEFDTTKTLKAYIRVIKAQKPQTILVENTEEFSDGEKTANALYFVSGESKSVKLNPVVYPETSYNTTWRYVIVNPEGQNYDCITIDENGVVTPVKGCAGKCDLILIPTASFTSETEYDISTCKIIEVTVADGSKEAPYLIRSAEEFFEIRNNLDKHFVLASNIDLTNYTVTDIINNQANFLPLDISYDNGYSLKGFSGSLNGQRVVGNVKVFYDISGIQINITPGMVITESNIKGNWYGLFAKNNGKIENLTVYYTSVSGICTASRANYALAANVNYNFNFGGISSLNNGEINNCKTTIYNFDVKSYFGNNNIGGICAINTGTISKCKVSGNVNLYSGTSTYNQNAFIGGIAGTNNKEILDEFDIYSKSTEFSGKNSVNSSIRITSIENDAYSSWTYSGFGLIAGKNTDTIEKVASYGIIQAIKNVGGIVGYNEGKIVNATSFSTILGKDNIGGIVGYNEGNEIKLSSVMWLDDGEDSKINGTDNVGGIIGYNNATNLNFIYNFVRSYDNNRIDMQVSNTTTFAGLIGKSDTDVKINSSFAKFKVNRTIGDVNYFANVNSGETLTLDTVYSELNGTRFESETKNFTTGGEIPLQNNGIVGIFEPESISVTINETTLNKQTVGTTNKFIRANDNTILLYYYNDNSSLNKYLIKALYGTKFIYPENSDSQFSAIQSLTSNSNIATIEDDYLIVKKTGNIVLTIQSLLNKDIKSTINIIIINKLNNLELKANEEGIKKSKTIKTGDSFKLTFNDELYQDNIYVSITSDADNIKLNNSELDNNSYYQVSSNFIIKGESKGIATIQVKAYYKISEETYIELPLEASFTLIVGEGLSEFILDINENSTLNLAPNSVINFNATILSDVLASTNVTVKIFECDNQNDINLEDSSSENFNFSVIKSIIENKSNFNISLDLKNNSISKNTVFMVLIANDELYSYNTIISDSQTYERYIKYIQINVVPSTIYSVDMSFFANAETINDASYGNITNADEVESKYINIGRVGLLKLNIYPISSSVKSVELTYSNLDNLTLSLSQLTKASSGYIDDNKASVIQNGIKFNFTQEELQNNKGYLYAKLLTPAPIKENSEYTLYCKLTFEDGTSLTFDKKLYTRLASSLEISFDNAILINSSELVGVYAKSVTNNQTIKLIVNRLQGYGEPVAHTSLLGVELALNNKTNLSDETTIYEYSIIGLDNSGVECDIYFTIDKSTNNKTDVIYSNNLKLTTVDFVVESVSIENVLDNIFYKPYGTKYNLNITLNTISDQSSETISKINSLQSQISSEILTWWENQNKLEIKNYGDFTISKEGTSLFITPNRVVNGNNLANAFKIVYKSDGKVGFETLTEYPTKNKEHAYSADKGFYTTLKNQFSLNFYLQTDINNPIPITSQEEFENMDTGGNYILLKNIVLKNYQPIDLDINSFDGNGFTISIESFDLSNEITENIYLGLFKSTLETTLLKNISLQYNLQTEQESNATLDLSKYSQVYFGGLVAENEGLIYNCSVQNYVELNTEGLFTILVNSTVNTLNYISSFVAINNGYISNSHSEMKLKVNRGIVGGFVSQNNKTIVSSYYKNATLILSGTSETTNKLGGFVQDNKGTIKYCYIEGESKYNTPNENGQYLSNKTLSDFCLMSPTNIGGFVYTNSGEIEDCYSNASIRGQSYSGGFVYENKGKITRSYAACLNDAENNTAHAPFIALKLNEDLSSQENNLINCFYLKTNTSTVNTSVATGLSVDEFKDEYYLTNFVFESDYGVYKYVDDKNLPTLVEANNLSVSTRTLYNTQENADGSLIYNYVYTQYVYGSKENPIIISNEEDFLYYFSNNSTSRISSYYRLICDIDFSEYSVIPSVNYVFSGRLDGNGMKISGLSISAETGYSLNSFGLFNKIEKSSNSSLIPIVKNLTISPTKVHANNVSKVGTLAGVCDDGILINISVDANSVIVQGKNIVGGVVGEVLGESKLINVTSNISANAGYEKTSINPYLYNSDEENTNAEKNDSISYVGSIAGVINIDEYELSVNEPIRNIEVSGNVKVIGEFAGLAFGLICENSGLDNIKVYTNNSSYINSLYASGVVVGENRGYISRAQAINLGNDDMVLFKNEAHFIGGIVGFNNNGTIVNSFSDVPVISENKLTFYAGGICGVTMGGSFSSLIAKNVVECNGTIGGIIGLSAKRDTLVYSGIEDSSDNNQIYQIELNDYVDSVRKNDKAIKENSIVFIANCLALNKFSDEILNKKILSNTTSNAEGQTIGAIIGATATTGEIKEGEYVAYNNVNYIYNNNYYIEYNITENEDAYYLNACGGINAQIDAGKCQITSEVKGEEIATKLNENTTNNVFDTWSASIWNIKENLIILNENSITSSLPTLKNTNNINSKKIEGEGTTQSPYLISSAYSLVELASIVESSDVLVNAKLIDNLELTGKTIDVIGKTNAFKGTFNGGGYTINGLTYINADKNETNTDNMFGLFGNNSANGNIINTNIVANMIIHFGRNVNRVGAIVANNKGYISNCNVYGGIICMLQKIGQQSSGAQFAEAYIGGIAGVNAGESANKGIVYSNNYAQIYVSSKNIEISSASQINVGLYVGGITGLNTNKAVINICENKASNTCELNGKYNIIVCNPYSAANYLGQLYGYNNSTSTTQSQSAEDKIYLES